MSSKFKKGLVTNIHLQAERPGEKSQKKLNPEMSNKVKNFLSSFIVEGDENFDHFISDITAISHAYGLDFWSRGWNSRRVGRSFIPLVVVFLYATVFEAYFLMEYRDDFVLMTHSLLAALQASLLLLKCLTLFVHREKFLLLTDEIRTDFWSTDDGGWALDDFLLAVCFAVEATNARLEKKLFLK